VIGEFGITSQQVLLVYAVTVTVAFALAEPPIAMPVPAAPDCRAVITTLEKAPPGAAVTFGSALIRATRPFTIVLRESPLFTV
jgi:hypothetical protein